MPNIPFPSSYWVIPGLFLAGEKPTAKTYQQTAIRLKALINIPLHQIINLMEAEEKDENQKYVFDYAPLMQLHNINCIRIPIRDMTIPTIHTMKSILDYIDQTIRESKTTYLHCWGGLGRTGTVVGCYMIRHGMADATNVFKRIGNLKRNTPLAGRISPETEQQKEFLCNWKLHQ